MANDWRERLNIDKYGFHVDKKSDNWFYIYVGGETLDDFKEEFHMVEGAAKKNQIVREMKKKYQHLECSIIVYQLSEYHGNF